MHMKLGKQGDTISQKKKSISKDPIPGLTEGEGTLYSSHKVKTQNVNIEPKKAPRKKPVPSRKFDTRRIDTRVLQEGQVLSDLAMHEKQQVVNYICAVVSSGETLASAVKEVGVGYNSFYNLLRKHPELDGLYKDAREHHAASLADRMIDLARSTDRDNRDAVKNELDVIKFLATNYYGKVFGQKSESKVDINATVKSFAINVIKEVK